MASSGYPHPTITSNNAAASYISVSPDRQHNIKKLAQDQQNVPATWVGYLTRNQNRTVAADVPTSHSIVGLMDDQETMASDGPKFSWTAWKISKLSAEFWAAEFRKKIMGVSEWDEAEMKEWLSLKVPCPNSDPDQTRTAMIEEDGNEDAVSPVRGLVVTSGTAGDFTFDVGSSSNNEPTADDD